MAQALTQQYDALQEEIQRLQAEHERLTDQLRTLEEGARQSLAGVPVERLATAATKQAEQRLQAESARIALDELARRIAEKRTEATAVQQKIRAETIAANRAALQRQAVGVVKDLRQALASCRAMFAEADRMSGETGGITYDVYVGRSTVESLTHRIERLTHEYPGVFD